MPRSPQRMDLYQIWFRGSSCGRNQSCGILLQSARHLPLTWPVAVNTVLALSRAACDNIVFTLWLLMCDTKCWMHVNSWKMERE